MTCHVQLIPTFIVSVVQAVPVRKVVPSIWIEAHDVGMMERVERYTEEKMMRRVVDSLRPQHKVSKPAGKRKDKKKTKKDEKNRKKNPSSCHKEQRQTRLGQKHAQKAAEAEKHLQK